MAQNTNFKGNKNNNQKKKLPYIKVKIDKIISLEESKTKAFASCKFSERIGKTVKSR